ncbi:MAG TPA: glycosyltransferase family 4 protein [Opitutaceae bacterium]|jgi:glycosyltransferase involved in cell wall biosynthesis|nr:glycosyltransferase family 4 protein [Opitutaceae bacterium]
MTAPSGAKAKMAGVEGRVLFVNRYYWPEETATAQLLCDLAEGLAARGRRVAVIARAPPGLPPGAWEARRGVDIIRVPAPRHAGTGIAAKALHFASFWLGARRALSRAVRPGDAVVALTDPPLMGVAAEAVARRRGARTFHWIQDIYPEVAEAVAGGAVWKVFRPMRDRSWARAEACVTLGSDMAGLVAERGVAPSRLHVQSNWAPSGLVPPPPSQVAAARAAWGASGQFVVGYSGNLGRVHDLDAVLALAEAFRGDPTVRFQITGSGPQRARVEALAARRNLSAIRFGAPAPRAELAAALTAADAHLVTLRAGCERCVFPSKLYGIAAVMRPILFLGPPHCEVARVVRETGLGAACSASDVAAAADALRSFRDDSARRDAAAAAARQFAAAHAGPAQAVELWDRLTRPA